MTGSGSGAPDRDITAARAPRRGVGRQILIVMAIGLVFRLIMAYGFEGLRGSGFDSDLALFRFWATELQQHGPFGFYSRGFFADYTPGYLYALWLVGIIGQWLGGVGDLIKLPAILTDVILGFVVYWMARDLGATERRATIAGAIVILNPITWFDSVIWGQVDSFGTVFLLLAVRELWKGRSERSAILAVVAALIKPQLAILIPIVALVVIRRALRPAGGWGDEPAPEPSGIGWERRTTGAIRIVTTGVAGFLTAVILSAPFGLSVVSFSTAFPFVDSALGRLVLSTAATYSYVSVNAYNLWALFPVNGSSMASNGTWIADAHFSHADPGTPWAGILGFIPAAAVGGLLLMVIMAAVSVLVARRPDRLTILVGTCVLALAFFAVPTRVHERYLFPLFGLAGIMLAFSWRWRIAYLVASVATFLNMYVVLTTLYPDNPSVADWLGIGPAIRSFWGVAAIAIAHTVVLVWALAQLRPGARRTLAAELEAARAPDEDELQADPEPELVLHPLPADVLEPAPSTFETRAVGAGAAAVVMADGPPPSAPPRRVPAWFDRPSWSELGPIAWLRARMGETPIRPDRSAVLRREGRGHFDRLDLWIVLVIVVAAMGLRMFRLSEPERMHFDEVYHARTAAEFLQDWRYGISHNIYEWTHPHLAKYAMAGGIVLFAGHDTDATSDLGVPVRDAAIEPRRPDPTSTTASDGDRAWIVTGDELRGYDLATRKLYAEWPIAGASALAFDPDSLQLYVGTDSGALYALDVSSLDGVEPTSPSDLPVSPDPIGSVDAPVSDLASFDGGQHVVARLPGDVIAVVDVATGEETGRVTVAGAADMVSAGSGDAITASPADVTDPSAAAASLATILGGDAASYRADLSDTNAESVVIPGELTIDVRTRLQAAIDAGSLPGIQVDKVPLVAVAGTDGVDFVTEQGTLASSLAMGRPANGLALVTGVDDGTQLYVTTTDDATANPEIAIVGVSGDVAKDGPVLSSTLQLPGPGTRVLFDDASQMVEVLGTTPDRSGTTVYVIETHGKSVFADQKLPFSPAAWVLDSNEQYPSTNRGQILAFAPGGVMASLDVGDYAFAWRLPGVILGALTAGVLYLLGRLLFRRRSVGVLVGLFVLLDGMFFVQSRIAMNDVYTGFFILAAYLLFAWLWLEPERTRRFWLLLPAVGVLLGLALASKWVAAYAIGALGILILARSALGRIVLILGLIALTCVLGWMGLAVPPGSNGSGNLLFALIMIGLTLAAVVITVYHPIGWSDDEVRLAVGGPAALGIIIAFGAIALGKGDSVIRLGPFQVTPITTGFALVALGIAMYVAFQVAARLGFGPLARPPAPDDPRRTLPPAASPATGWLRLGSGLGLPIVWMLGSLLVIPLAVYVVSYIPWAMIEGHQIIAGWPPGHTGQTLLDLTAEMYRYHNNLTAAHPASSPWWAWPLNLKPVWFYQGGFANDTAGSIYDAGNMIIWWLGIPAMVFVAIQAFRRQSLPLALILIGFLCQWISWARIDRAAFQYHYYTSLAFVVLALGYFVAELWHGASRRTWWLARIAAAVALMGPVILWLLRHPLCGIANVDAVNKGSAACTGNPGNLVVTPAAAALVVVGIVTGIVIVRMLIDLGRSREDGEPRSARDLLPLALTALVGGLALAVSRAIPSSEPLFSLPGIVPELIALLIAIPLLLVALQIVTARDARRFVAGLIAAIAIWFVLLYPNIAALPLPATIVNAYQGLLPTYLYAFQFSVNTVDRSGSISFSDPRFIVLVAFLVLACAIVAYSAWIWRQALADPREGSAPDSASSGPEGEPGAA